MYLSIRFRQQHKILKLPVDAAIARISEGASLETGKATTSETVKSNMREHVSSFIMEQETVAVDSR